MKCFNFLFKDNIKIDFFDIKIFIKNEIYSIYVPTWSVYFKRYKI